MPAFFDTNVLVYCVDPRDAAKQARARELVASASAGNAGMVSTQVLIELFSVLTRKQKIPEAIAAELVQAYTLWPVVDSDLKLCQSATATAVEHGLSIFDAMIVQAAIRSGADILYSEDLQHGREFGPLKLVNPFS
ncbi:PIN domain-containing protein [Variovorax sp. KK3]|uniref:PIN domain-containing protein n=1 Tax=Variovorax sp. KK3 TaxID=1855728 RepID=UPI00097C7D1C|nr:PIN domain-containing protein [Variovorax sp. KK3]